MVAFPWGVGAATGQDPGCASRIGKPGARDAEASLFIYLRRTGVPGPYHKLPKVRVAPDACAWGRFAPATSQVAGRLDLFRPAPHIHA